MDEHKKKNDNWMKYALILILLFIICYLSAYYVLDRMKHYYFIPPQMGTIDNVIQEQDKMFKEMNTFPMHYNAMVVVQDPVETYKDEADNSYKMIIDLKPFNDNIKNIKLDIKEHKVSIMGEAEKNKGNSDKVYSFSQSFVLPEEIEVDKVKKEVSGHNYVITLPIDD